MSMRSFLLASSLARLAAKARGGLRITEGYFPAVNERSTSVQVEGETAAILVTTSGPGVGDPERAQIPRAHAEALLAVTAGQIDRLRTHLSIDTHPIRLDRIVSPGLLDLITVEFDSDEDARGFQPPAWFGPEVSDEPGYQDSALGLKGLPATRDLEATNAALDSLLDVLEDRTLAAEGGGAHGSRDETAPCPAAGAGRSRGG